MTTLLLAVIPNTSPYLQLYSYVSSHIKHIVIVLFSLRIREVFQATEEYLFLCLLNLGLSLLIIFSINW